MLPQRPRSTVAHPLAASPRRRPWACFSATTSTRTIWTKHFELDIANGHLAYRRKAAQIEAEAALDGLYVLRTTVGADELGTAAVVRAYKQLKLAERAFRAMKDTLEIRPLYHHSPPASERTCSYACSPTTSPLSCGRAWRRCCSPTKPHSPRSSPSPPRSARRPPTPRPAAAWARGAAPPPAPL